MKQLLFTRVKVFFKLIKYNEDNRPVKFVQHKIDYKKLQLIINEND